MCVKSPFTVNTVTVTVTVRRSALISACLQVTRRLKNRLKRTKLVGACHMGIVCIRLGVGWGMSDSELSEEGAA